MKRIFISLLCLLLIGQNLSPVMFAEENPSGISENGSGMVENESGMSENDAENLGEGEAGSQEDSTSQALQNDSEGGENIDEIGEGDLGNAAPLMAPQGGDSQPLMAPGQMASIEISSNGTGMARTLTKVFTVTAVLNQQTQDTKINVTIPSNLEYDSHLISEMELLDPVENVEINTENGDTLLIVSLKDGLVGEFNMSTSIKFPAKTSYKGEDATVVATIFWGEEEADSQTITFVQTQTGGITFKTPTFSMMPDSTKDFTFSFISRIGNGNHNYGYHSNVYLRIPLPDGISITGDIVCEKCKSVSYDTEENVLHVYYPDALLYTVGYPISFNLLYTGAATGTFVSSEPITAEGMAGGKVLRIYTGSKMKVNIVNEEFKVSISHLYRHGLRNEFLVSRKRGPVYIFHRIINNGIDVDNLEIELSPPPEIEINAVRLPGTVSNALWGTWEEREIEFEYDTNMRTNVITGFEAPDSPTSYYFDLQEGEQIARIVIKMKNLKHGEYFSSNADGTNPAAYYHQLTFYGDVASEHSDGTPIQEGEMLTTQRIYRINGEEYLNSPFDTKWTEIPWLDYVGLITRWNYTLGYQYNRGDTIIKNIILRNGSYPRGNGGTGIDPNIYLIVNNSLNLDTDLSHWATGSAAKVISVEEFTSDISGDVGDAKVYKVKTQMTIPPGSNSDAARSIKVPFIVKDDAIPGSYNESKSVYLNFDKGYYTSPIKDEFGLIGQVNEKSLTRITNSNPTYTIIGSSYGMSSRIKSQRDPNRKAGYEGGDDSSLSITTDNAPSTYRQIFYNESLEDMNDLEIVVPLPQKNDENGSEWSGVLTGEVVVSGATADISYSSDGVSYMPSSGVTNLSSIKYVKLNIATCPAKSQVIVDMDILATGNPTDGEIAQIYSQWTIGDQDFTSQIQAMVYHPAPKATITYSPSTPTTGGVVATISFDQANVEITNNSGSVDYLFTQTGEFLYEWRSMRNITGTTLAKVTWIIPEPTTPTLTKHTVTFVDDDGTTLLRPATEYDYGTPASDIIRPADPTKKGYKFTGWTPSITDVVGNVVYRAIYKKDGGGRSGGGNPKCEGDCECKGDCEDPEPEHGSPEEERDMHKWAYDNGLTIYKPGEDAKFDQPLTRQQMAKISSIFGANFLNQKADVSEGKIMECSQYSDLDKSKGEMRGYVIQSCLMKNMGYHYDNVNYIPKFKPYDKLSVAQASVILSRMAWGTKYVISPKMWYQGHMQAVYDHGLIDDISDPSRKITRGEAFMMMYRLDKLMNESEK